MRKIKKNIKKDQYIESEHSIQSSIMLYWKLQCSKFGLNECLLFAIPNGGRRDAITGKKLKDEGVRPGVPDMMLAVSQYPFNGLFIELKKVGGRLSKEQIAYLELLRSQKYYACVCYGFEDAISTITKYLTGDLPCQNKD